MRAIYINGMSMTEIIEERNSLEYKIRKESGKLENLLNHLKRNKRKYFTAITIVAIMLMSGYISPSSAAMLSTPNEALNVTEAINRINDTGEQILMLIRVIAYWVVLVITSKDCIREALNGDKKSIGQVVSRGLIIMATIYFLPAIFSMMSGMVNGL